MTTNTAFLLDEMDAKFLGLACVKDLCKIYDFSMQAICKTGGFMNFLCMDMFHILFFCVELRRNNVEIALDFLRKNSPWE